MCARCSRRCRPRSPRLAAMVPARTPRRVIQSATVGAASRYAASSTLSDDGGSGVPGREIADAGDDLVAHLIDCCPVCRGQYRPAVAAVPDAPPVEIQQGGGSSVRAARVTSVPPGAGRSGIRPADSRGDVSAISTIRTPLGCRAATDLNVSVVSRGELSWQTCQRRPDQGADAGASGRQDAGMAPGITAYQFIGDNLLVISFILGLRAIAPVFRRGAGRPCAVRERRFSARRVRRAPGSPR